MTSNYAAQAAVPSSPRDPVPTSPAIAKSPSAQQPYGMLPHNMQIQMQQQQQMTSQGYHNSNASNNIYQNARYSSQNVFQFDHLYQQDEKKPVPQIQVKVDNHSPSVNMNFTFPQTHIKTEPNKGFELASGIVDEKPSGLSPLHIAVTFQDGSQASPVSSQSLVSHTGLRFQRSSASGDAMLSAINYSENDVLHDGGFDVAASLGNIDDGILASMNNNGNLRISENHPPAPFDLFDGDGNVNEAYIEPSQDLQLNTSSFPETGPNFSISDSSNITDDGIRQGDDRQGSSPANNLQRARPPQTQNISRPDAPAPRTKGRPGRSGRAPGSRPNLTCPTCGKTFNNSSAIAKHKLTHSDERKYVCTLCSKAFKRQDHLNGHMLTHRDKKPYECKFDGCDKSYSDARSLRRHLENHHQNIDPLHYGSNNTNGRLYAGYNYNGSNQSQYFQFDKSSQYGNNNSQDPQWQAVRYRSGDNSPGYLQQVSPISPAPGHPTSPMHSNAPRMPWVGALFDDSLKPVECTLCHRRFKNIPALNGHMRLHGGYFKKQDTLPQKKDVNETNGKHQQPTQLQTSTTARTFQAPRQKQLPPLPPPPPPPPPHSVSLSTVQTTLSQQSQKLPSISQLSQLQLQSDYLKHQHQIRQQRELQQQQQQQEQQAVAALQQLQQQPIHHQPMRQEQQQQYSAVVPLAQNQTGGSVASILQQHLRLPSVSSTFMLPQTQTNLNLTSDSSLDLQSSMLPLTTDGDILGVQLSHQDLKQVVSTISENILPNVTNGNLTPSLQTLLQSASDSLNTVTSTQSSISQHQQPSAIAPCEDDSNIDPLFSNQDISNFATTEGTRLTDGVSEPLDNSNERVLIRDSMLSAASNAPLSYADKDNEVDQKNLAVQLIIKSPTSHQTFSFPNKNSQQLPIPKVSNMEFNIKNPKTFKNNIFERKRHFSADPDKYTAPKRMSNGSNSLAVLLASSNLNRKLDSSGSKLNIDKAAPSNMKRQSSSDKDDGVFQRPSDDALPRSRPRSRAEDPLSRSYPGPSMEDCGIFRNPSSLSTSPAKIKKKHRPEPLFIPPHVNHFGFQSRLRSPRLWDVHLTDNRWGNRGNTPPPYTPPPMLSPVRKGSGLFWTLQTSYRPVTPKSAPITPKIPRSSTIVAPCEPTVLEEPEEDPPPETDIQPHVNIGAQYQAEIPSFENGREVLKLTCKEDLLWEPSSYGENTEEEVQFYLDFACCAAVPGNGTNKEYAIHLLHLSKGQIQDALVMLMQGEPMVPKDHTLSTYKYQETGMWTTDEIEQYHQALLKCDKDFFQISKEISSKSTKECVEFYYLWKKVCPDEYKRLRIIRRKREQEEIHNLRSKAAQEKMQQEDELKESNIYVQDKDDGNEEGPFGCLYSNCCATFRSKQALNGHIRVHYINKPDSTEEISRIKISSQSRNNNMEVSPSSRSHTSDELDEYPCKICGKVFYKVKSRSAHMKSHRPTDGDIKPKLKG